MPVLTTGAAAVEDIKLVQHVEARHLPNRRRAQQAKHLAADGTDTEVGPLPEMNLWWSMPLKLGPQ